MAAARTLFATQLYEATLADDRDFPGFNAELEEACLMLAAEDAAGRAWCKARGYGGYTSYASLNDLPQRASVFGELKRRLDRHAAAFAGMVAFDLGGRRPKLDSLWVNVLKPGAAHSGHIHPHSIISGTVYVIVPPNAAAIRFEDPRLAMMMAAPTRTPDAPEMLKTFVSVAPEPGTILMWESWLRHEVPVNAARSNRISISFNYA